MTDKQQRREDQRSAFLLSAGWKDAQQEALVPDASFRCYYKLIEGSRSAVLMDAPPEHEKIEPFLKITFHLQELGVRVPEVYHYDVDSGFVLLEDLGDNTFTKLLDAGVDEQSLYRLAMDAILRLQTHPECAKVDVEPYDFDHYMTEAVLLAQWYLPAVSGEPLPQTALDDYRSAWKSVFNALPDLSSTLVLRDFHVDNIILVDGRCALLDYQDALIGSPAYDVVSLLEDARRDVPPGIVDQCMEAYYYRFPRIDRAVFDHHYRVWGAQRHAKVLGIFVRLWLRDDKPAYCRHLPRVWKLLMENLEYPCLAPVKQWLGDQGFDTVYQDIGFERDQLCDRLQQDRKST